MLLSVVAPVLAADEEPPEDAVADAPVRLEEVVVTGSRIHMPNLSSASPIYHIDAEALTFQGNVRVEDTLRDHAAVVLHAESGNIQRGQRHCHPESS